MIHKRIRFTILLLLLLQISVSFAKREIKKPNDAYDLYWNEPVTSESIHTATYEVTQKLMDANVDPCDDFYEYACGNFEMNNPIPKGQKKINIFSILQNRLDYNLKQALLEDLDNKDSNESGSSEEKKESQKYDSSDTELKLKNFVKSCMNVEQIEKDGLTDAIQYLETLDGWPLSELENRVEPFDWVNLTAHVNQFNDEIIFNNYAKPGIDTEDQYVIGLDFDSAHFYDRDRYNMTNEATKNHFYYMYSYLIKSVFKRFGANVNNLGATIIDIINFEVGYVSIYLEHNDSSENETEITIEKLHEIVPEIDWQMYYTVLFGRKIEMSEKLVIPGEEFIKEIVEYLNKTNPETIAKYIFFRTAANLDEMMNENLFELEKRRVKKIKGDRFVQCLQIAQFPMSKALSAFFIRRHFYLDSKKDIENMVAEIKNEFYDFINRTDWIDQPHKELAFNKLDLMTAKIGYSEGLLSHETLNDEYASLDIKSDSFLSNMILFCRFFFQKYSALIGKFTNESMWSHDAEPYIVNAYYNPWAQGAMIFPAAILHSPFYHYYAPGWVKYGAMGSIMGHEMVHAFDSDNMVLDSSAKVHDFKSLKVIGKYYARSVCMSNQYSKYKFKETGNNLDGSQTLDENISDNGGMALALDAYRKWLILNPDLAENEKVPGLDLSPEQLFFLAHAQGFCETLSPEAILRYIERDSHAPLKFRVIGSVSNSDSFSTAYNCPYAAPMNPVRKCKYD